MIVLLFPGVTRNIYQLLINQTNLDWTSVCSDNKFDKCLQQSRRSYTAYKLDVANYAEENGSNMAAQRKYGVNEKVIRGWRNQKGALRNIYQLLINQTNLDWTCVF
jgi:hypothetical protein